MADLLPVCPAAVLLVSLVLVVLRVLGPPLAFLVFPASTGPLVSLVPADLSVPGPLAFLVLPAREAVVQASLAVTVALTATPEPMRTATPPTMATAAQAMATAMDRGDTATGPYGVYVYSNSSDSSGCYYTYKYSSRLRRLQARSGLLRRVSAAASGGRMPVDTAILTPVSLFLGALIGGGASLCAAVYTQRYQDRLQRIAGEIAKREAVYADFVMSASNVLLHAFTHDDVSPSGDEQRLIGLINRMRLFAPHNVVSGAEAVLRAIVEIALRPSIELRQLAKEALSKSPDPDPLLAFSEICRADLDSVRRSAL